VVLPASFRLNCTIRAPFLTEPCTPMRLRSWVKSPLEADELLPLELLPLEVPVEPLPLELPDPLPAPEDCAQSALQVHSPSARNKNVRRLLLTREVASNANGGEINFIVVFLSRPRGSPHRLEWRREPEAIFGLCTDLDVSPHIRFVALPRIK
jgi:hypothetical protein